MNAFELLGFKMFTRTDPSKSADWLIGSVAGNFILSLRQSSRAALLPQQVSPSLVFLHITLSNLSSNGNLRKQFSVLFQCLFLNFYECFKRDFISRRKKWCFELVHLYPALWLLIFLSWTDQLVHYQLAEFHWWTS